MIICELEVYGKGTCSTAKMDVGEALRFVDYKFSSE